MKKQIKSLWIALVIVGAIAVIGWFKPTAERTKKSKFVSGDVVRTHPRYCENIFPTPTCKEEEYSSIKSNNYEWAVLPEGGDPNSNVAGFYISYFSSMERVWLCKHAKKIFNLNEKP